MISPDSSGLIYIEDNKSLIMKIMFLPQRK